MATERSPLLGDLFNQSDSEDHDANDVDLEAARVSAKSHHAQFCMLMGIPELGPDGMRQAMSTADKSLLYTRATRRKRSQSRAHACTAALSNGLLLAQVILAAALTALGAAEASHVLVAVFGATNTILAGLIAYLKSRGQPARARAFRDDLERVVDEIENSEIMWLGIAHGVHGYDSIARDPRVTVRSEVARLTRLYEQAVRHDAYNDPDLYLAASATTAGAELVNFRAAKPAGNGSNGAVPLPRIAPAAPAEAASPAPTPAAPAASTVPDINPDASPAVAPNLGEPVAAQPQPASAAPEPNPASAPLDPDMSPATAPPATQETPKPASNDSPQAK